MHSSVKYLWILSIICIGMVSCQQNSGSANGPQVDISEYQKTKFKDGLIYVYKMDENKNILEDGYVKGGAKQGPWSTYTSDGRITSLTSYVDGKKTGKVMEFDKLMNLQQIESFADNELNGMSSFFKRGRYAKRYNYENGVLNGLGEEFFTSGMRQGRIQKRMHFKNGELDGKMEFFNEDGERTLEYQYRNGKQVGGGEIQK